ncbi:mandelate racemase/muconate lactonizing enzyme family protein [Isosphaeraceae bacterium EP7]
MDLPRRRFLGTGLAAGMLACSPLTGKADEPRLDNEALDRIANAPVLDVAGLNSPLKISAMDLLRNGRNFVVRVRTSDGAEGLAVPNSMHMVHLYPIFTNRIAPFFVGKDARDLEGLLWELYRHNDNYKYQGLPLWVCTAGAEFAVLDLLGKASGKSIGTLIGGVKRPEIAVYRASGTRGNTPEAELDDLRKLVEESGAKALKFRLGGMMRRDNAETPPGRSERLIPLVREAFGPSMTLYADSNSSYSPAEAIRIGRLMEQHNYAFYEEPCRYDDHDGTKLVADALTIPVAAGEQESSEFAFRRMIRDRVVDIVQPDLHYYGGFIRSMRVARMAHAAGMLCTPHMSGSGLGYLDAAIFAACIPNPVPFTEFKGNADFPVSSLTASLKVENGIVKIPTGPGFGVEIDPTFLRESKQVGRA